MRTSTSVPAPMGVTRHSEVEEPDVWFEEMSATAPQRIHLHLCEVTAAALVHRQIQRLRQRDSILRHINRVAPTRQPRRHRNVELVKPDEAACQTLEAHI